LPFPADMPLEEFPGWHVVNKQEPLYQTLAPVVVTDRDLNQFSREMRELATAEGVKTVCFIPLVNRGRTLGVLAISRTTEESFSQHDIEFLSQASGQIAIAVENTLAFREISDLKDNLAQEKVYRLTLRDALMALKYNLGAIETGGKAQIASGPAIACA
jgi:GAF domain-containing protein